MSGGSLTAFGTESNGISGTACCARSTASGLTAISTAIANRFMTASSDGGQHTTTRPWSAAASVLRGRRFDVIDHDHFLVALLRLEPQAKLLLDRFEDGVAAARVRCGRQRRRLPIR